MEMQKSPRRRIHSRRLQMLNRYCRLDRKCKKIMNPQVTDDELAQHFKNLLNATEEPNEELIEVSGRMKNGKATGTKGIKAEVFTNATPELIEIRESGQFTKTAGEI